MFAGVGNNSMRGIQRVNNIDAEGPLGRCSYLDAWGGFKNNRLIIGPGAQQSGSDYLGNYDEGTYLLVFGLHHSNTTGTPVPNSCDIHNDEQTPEIVYSGTQDFGGDSGGWRFELFPIRRSTNFIRCTCGDFGAGNHGAWLIRQANKATLHASGVSTAGVDNVSINTVSGGYAAVIAVRQDSGSITAISNCDDVQLGGVSNTLIVGMDFNTSGSNTNYSVTHDGDIIFTAAISIDVS